MKCKLCGSEMAIREGKYGRFWGCRNYPQCKNKQPFSGNDKQRTSFQAKTPAPQLTPTAPRFAPSPEQVEIIHSVQNNQFTFVRAGAGCAKTTTMVFVAYDVPAQWNVIALAFNRSIADELKARMPANVKSSTWHSLGMSILETSEGKKPQIIRNKVENYAKEYFPIRAGRGLTNEEKQQNATNIAAIAAVKKLVSLCKASMFSGKRHEIDELVDRQGLEINEETLELVAPVIPKIMVQCLRDRSIVDFDDMIWIPAMMFRYAPTFTAPNVDLIMSDESQDLNAAQHQLLMAILSKRPETKLLVVGDANQAIYGWRGASFTSMSDLKAMVEKVGAVVELPLMKTRRCPKAVVAQANLLVPDLEALEEAPDGKVIKASELPYQEMLETPGNFMVTCRTNAPLIREAFKFIRAGVPMYIQGRAFGEDLLLAILQSGATTTQELTAWCDGEITKIIKDREDLTPGQLTRVDMYETLSELALGFSSVADLEDRIKTLFSDEARDDAVLLSSVHRCKGLERHTQVCMPPHAPHPMAKTEEAKGQEKNLLYVQWTRAKERLMIVVDRNGYAYDILEAV